MNAPTTSGRSLRPPPRPALVQALRPVPEGVLVHPVANLFRMMTLDEHRRTVESIKKHGLREPIRRLAGPHAGKWLHAIIDGRNRLDCCLAAGVEPIFEDFEWDGEESLADLSVVWNLERRDLTTADRVKIASDLLPLYAEEAKERMERGLLQAQSQRRLSAAEPGDPASPGSARTAALPSRRDEKGRATAKAAARAKVGEVTLKRYQHLSKRAPELASLVDDGRITIREGYALAKLEGEARATAVDRIMAGAAAAAVIKATIDSGGLSAKEQQAARILKQLPKERQQLVLAEGKVDAQALAGPNPAGAPKTTTTLLDRVLADPQTTTVDWRAVGVREAKTARLLRPKMVALTLDEQVDYVVGVVVAARWGLLEPPSELVAAIREGARAELCGEAQLTSGVLEGAQGRPSSPEAARPQVLAECPWVLLWSHEKKMWWAANGDGYTKKLKEAGLYTWAEATRQAHGFSVVVPLTGKPPRPPKKGDTRITAEEAYRRAQAIREEEGERSPRIRR